MQRSAIVGLLAAVAWGLPAIGAASPVQNCYEGIGCPWKETPSLKALLALSCESLAHVRNQLYHEKGYCFHSPAPRKLYGNAGCRFPVQELVPLTRIERASIAAVRKAEQRKGCKRP